MRFAWLAAGSFALCMLGASCSDEAPACYDGEYLACSCADADGFQRCERGAYAACVCDGTVPGLETVATPGGAGGQGGQGGAPLLGFLETCDDDDECETGLCHRFNAKGPKCSTTCGVDDDCPPPSPGCNKMGVCKAP